MRSSAHCEDTQPRALVTTVSSAVTSSPMHAAAGGSRARCRPAPCHWHLAPAAKAPLVGAASDVYACAPTYNTIFPLRTCEMRFRSILRAKLGIEHCRGARCAAWVYEYTLVFTMAPGAPYMALRHSATQRSENGGSRGHAEPGQPSRFCGARGSSHCASHNRAWRWVATLRVAPHGTRVPE